MMVTPTTAFVKMMPKKSNNNTPRPSRSLVLLGALLLRFSASSASHVVGPGALSPYSGGGGRQRARSYVRVQDPAVGFFVAGSSNDGINGLYSRTDSIPSSLAGSDRRFSLMYNHLDSGWNLGLAETGWGSAR